MAQKRRPVKDDWVLTLNDDKEAAKINLTDEEISTIKKEQFKNMIKSKIRKLVFDDLEKIRMGHSKVNSIIYKKFETQPYISSGIFEKQQIYILFKLRTRMVDVKRNFQNYYDDKIIMMIYLVDSVEKRKKPKCIC